MGIGRVIQDTVDAGWSVFWAKSELEKRERRSEARVWSFDHTRCQLGQVSVRSGEERSLIDDVRGKEGGAGFVACTILLSYFFLFGRAGAGGATNGLPPVSSVPELPVSCSRLTMASRLEDLDCAGASIHPDSQSSRCLLLRRRIGP